MKKFFLFCTLVTFLSLPELFTQEKISFQLNAADIDLLKISRDFTSMNYLNPLPVINYAKTLTDEQVDRTVKRIESANMVLSIITMTGYTANIILGSFVLAEKFQDMPYWNAILYTHIPIGITSGLLGAAVISLGYVDLGLRSKYHLFSNRANAVSIYINTGLAAAEIGFVVANLITSRLNPEAAKWIGLAHAITTACLMIGITVQFGTSFIKK